MTGRERAAHDVGVDTALGRSRLISAVTLVVGAIVLGWSLSIEPGASLFYGATALLALVWIVGALLARGILGHPLHRVVGQGRDGARDLALGLVTGLALGGIFLVGALVLARIPALRAPVETLLAHADQGIFVVVLALTLLNGYAEELFFRGALFDALPGHGARLPIIVTSVVYTVVTAAAGIWMLAVAGLVLGLVCAVLRARTGGTSAAIVCHLTWSLIMIFLLPRALDLWS